MKMKLKLKSVGIVAALCLLSAQAWSYEFTSGKFFLKGVVGPSVNIVRYTGLSAVASPNAGLLLGVEGEYVVDQPWSIIGGIRPVFSPGFIDVEFGGGVKYRWADLGMPLVLSASIELTPSILFPLSSASSRFNLGLRPAVGADYFLMRDLVLGVQIAFEPSVILSAPARSFEATIEFLFGMMYRI